MRGGGTDEHCSKRKKRYQINPWWSGGDESRTRIEAHGKKQGEVQTQAAEACCEEEIGRRLSCHQRNFIISDPFCIALQKHHCRLGTILVGLCCVWTDRAADAWVSGFRSRFSGGLGERRRTYGFRWSPSPGRDANAFNPLAFCLAVCLAWRYKVHRDFLTLTG